MSSKDIVLIFGEGIVLALGRPSALASGVISRFSASGEATFVVFTSGEIIFEASGEDILVLSVAAFASSPAGALRAFSSTLHGGNFGIGATSVAPSTLHGGDDLNAAGEDLHGNGGCAEEVGDFGDRTFVPASAAPDGNFGDCI